MIGVAYHKVGLDLDELLLARDLDESPHLHKRRVTAK